MSSPRRIPVLLGVLLLFASAVAAGQDIEPGKLVTSAEGAIAKAFDITQVLDAAKTLFWSLAVMSLVWTMGMLILRQDLGEVLIELIRFMIVTGTFYWLLINASDGQGDGGFIADIVDSFFEMENDLGRVTFGRHADGFVARGLATYFSTLDATRTGSDPDQILAGGIAVLILVLLTIVGAQFLVALVMAWLLGYAGIFLLGFGGARWTSQLAVSYYKHALAVGITVLVLGLLGAGGHRVIDRISTVSMNSADPQFFFLGMMLAVSVLVLVLAVRIPQFFYTMVTGSQLGVLAGSASVIGSAIATGGGAAIAAATGRVPGASPAGGMGAASSARTGSVMDAVHRSAASGSSMGDPFHVAPGSDPFGVSRGADAVRRAGSVFGPAGETRPGTDVAERREGNLS
ncbi:P-type conjugative transfer protein TrbL [Dyella sp. 333MFSha]|uniref:P-type conjugative transfer protein TrbL n=1 Tax=Dyella sp. 333MFSha TaxID=1798240 RepID=UPI00088A1253|nr:P-type conjugative transfer protein TrbL [Dyella sp. 333MFSha]SDG18557.1 type IV secretion system protein TrbL [Dyella sp. 333MFSha]